MVTFAKYIKYYQKFLNIKSKKFLYGKTTLAASQKYVAYFGISRLCFFNINSGGSFFPILKKMSLLPTFLHQWKIA